MGNITKVERERRAALKAEQEASGTVDAVAVVKVKRERKPPTDFRLAETASKKYSKVLARENAALDRAATTVKERFQLKKDAFLDSLTDNVKTLVLASSQPQVVLDEVEDPDVSENEDETVTAVAV